LRGNEHRIKYFGGAGRCDPDILHVGVSVTAMWRVQLDTPGNASAVDVVQRVPALQFSAWTPASTIFSLRGISQDGSGD